MISKMKPVQDRPETPWLDGGSRIAIVLSGSPLFSGAAGGGESEIRRWIIENDWLEGIVALPDQMFYNTGISTYVWILTNRKPADRVGTVTLVDARELGTKMRKSLGDKRKELTPAAIGEISRLFTDAPDLVQASDPDPRVKPEFRRSQAHAAAFGSIGAGQQFVGSRRLENSVGTRPGACRST